MLLSGPVFEDALDLRCSIHRLMSSHSPFISAVGTYIAASGPKSIIFVDQAMPVFLVITVLGESDYLVHNLLWMEIY